jgi:prepilin-type processing-associated H-X9-DG protein
MNYMVSLTPTHPALFNAADQTNIPSKEWLNIQLKAGGGTIPASGTWYKLSQITMPAQRCFLADAAALQLEAWKWEAGQIPQSQYGSVPPMGHLPALANQSMYSAGINCQTTFDYYRHGIYPRQINYTGFWGSGTCFDPAGGKVSYNILYYDGHAISTTDRTEAYRSVRMRWPG